MPQNTRTTSSASDHLSPYYIHPSENTSLPLIAEKFNGEGYGEWKRSMKIAFSAKNKLSFLDGSLRRPSSTDVDFKA